MEKFDKWKLGRDGRASLRCKKRERIAKMKGWKES